MDFSFIILGLVDFFLPSCFAVVFYSFKHQLHKYFNDNQKLLLRDVLLGKIHQIHLWQEHNEIIESLTCGDGAELLNFKDLKTTRTGMITLGKMNLRMMNVAQKADKEGAGGGWVHGPLVLLHRWPIQKAALRMNWKWAERTKEFLPALHGTLKYLPGAEVELGVTLGMATLAVGAHETLVCPSWLIIFEA